MEHGKLIGAPLFERFLRPAVVWGVVSVLTAISLYTWLRYFQPAPYYDMVDLEWFLAQWSAPEDGWGPLITYHDNEHRAFLPVLLQAFDHKVLASTGLFLILVHIGCFLTAALASARHAWLGVSQNPRLAHLAASAMTLLMLWSSQWNNIIRTKQTHTCLSIFFVMLAFWAAVRFDARRTEGSGSINRAAWAELVPMLLFLVGAIWSFTAGLAAVPALILFAFVRRWPWRSQALLVLVSAASIIAWGWAYAEGGNPTHGGSAPIFHYFAYALNLFGGLYHFALAGDEVVAPILGVLTFALAALVLFYSFSAQARRRAGLSPDADRSANFFTLVLLWAVVCVVSIASARAQFGPGQAFVTRYVPFGVTFFASTAMLAILFRSLLPGWTRRAVYVVLGFYLVAVVAVSPRGWISAADHNRLIALGGVAASLAIDDSQYTLYRGFGGGRLLDVVEDYRTRGASYYRRDWGRWLGQPINTGSEKKCGGVSGEGTLVSLEGGGV